MAALSVLIADDHQLVRDMIAHYLSAEPDVSIEVAESLSGVMAALAERGSFDIVLLDVTMPGMQGLPSIEAAVAANRGGAVVLFSGSVRRSFVVEALSRGARGFVPKTLPARSLIHALRQVAAGRSYLPVAFLADENAEMPDFMRGLTPQEGRVLRRLCQGMTNKEIARDMDLSEVTIKTHMRAICAKLGARNRTHAAMIANPHILT
jgi:DNA-binding NarL/FixJ family response regulator